jgi:hypothetical protein
VPSKPTAQDYAVSPPPLPPTVSGATPPPPPFKPPLLGINLTDRLLNATLLSPSSGGGGSGTCPDGSRPVNCLVSPCSLNAGQCPGGTRCFDDYCGGCGYKCVGTKG